MWDNQPCSTAAFWLTSTSASGVHNTAQNCPGSFHTTTPLLQSITQAPGHTSPYLFPPAVLQHQDSSNYAVLKTKSGFEDPPFPYCNSLLMLRPPQTESYEAFVLSYEISRSEESGPCFCSSSEEALPMLMSSDQWMPVVGEQRWKI